MELHLEDTMALLERTPATLNALLRGLPEFWTEAREGEGSWTPFDVVGHLLYTDRTDWLQRARRILEFGEEKPFEPLDRLGQNRESRGKTLGKLLDEFMQVRAKNLEELRALQLGPRELARTGRHPALGVVTLSQLLAAWAAHDMTHLHQLSRVLARQYAEAVGPWSKFLGVLQCAGHSASA